MWSQELAQVADGRIFALLGLGGPVIAWVLFNILGPAQRQIDNMADKQNKPASKRRALVAGLTGLSAAALAAVPSADAAQACLQ